MEHFYALLLVMLEMTFVVVAIGMLHNQRKSIGNASFYLALGLLFLFSQMICAADFRAHLFGTLDFQMGSTVLFLPYLGALLMVYITEGTLAAQRLIIGSLVLFGLFFYLGEITRIQGAWNGYSITSGVAVETLDHLLAESRRTMIAMVVSHLVDLFMLPIIYTRLKNAGAQLFLCVFGALLFTQIADSILYVTVLYWDRPDQLTLLGGSFLARLISTVWLSILLTIYLRKIESDNTNRQRAALDIIFAFFGGYGRSQQLEASLRDWEDRYQQLLRNASEMILMLDTSGNILDANRAAAAMMNFKNPSMLIGRNIRDLWEVPEEEVVLPEPPASSDQPLPPPLRYEAFFAGKERRVSCSLSLIQMRSGYFLVLIGRDITEESRLAEDKQRLSEQLEHSQRLESLGKLAGGVAHDFNNHLHAILGHIDVIEYMHPPEDPEVVRHLKKIAEIAEASGKLTSQLLGFARKGKYQIVNLNMTDLIEQSIGMLTPQSHGELSVEFHKPPCTFLVEGDQVQVQQMLLNLMLNGIDAMAENRTRPRTLTLSLMPASEAPVKVEVPGDFPQPVALERYCCVSVADNGHGMDKATLSKIFEPFFTTKPVGKGTGMGLAMVYGTITSHHGWVQVTSRRGKGTVFYLFMPCSVKPGKGKTLAPEQHTGKEK